MLPSRGLTRNPASVLRYSLTSRIKPARTSTRQFSQAQSQSSVLSRRGLSRAGIPQHGCITPALPTVGSGVSAGIASSVFAQRSGAARNLSLWPFQSKPETTPQPIETPPESAAPTPAEAQAPMSSAPATPEYQPDISALPEDLLAELDSTSILDIPERIGFLKELGLDFGYGPTTCCEWLLEHIHVYSGLPWWGSIAAVAVLFRAAMFYPALNGSKHQARLKLLQTTPEYKKAKADFDEAVYRTKDQAAMMYARSEMKRLMSSSGASMWQPFVNFAMIPFSYGMFRLIRGMAGIPVPGMESGGLAWFSDLTVHDPLYLLPCASVGLAVIMFKQMQRANVTSDTMQQTMMKGMMYIMPPLMFLGTAWLPAALQWFFLVLSIGSVAQTQATLMPSVRRWAELPPLPSPEVAAAQAVEYQGPTKRGGGFRDTLEQGVTAASKSLKEATGTTDEKARWKRAQEYEEQRALEEKEKTLRRIEEVRRRRAERQ
ncbi:hypothetical protein F4802DRAFT_578046 [Xylaria palmicola]|nr:hypothetical protein F4802DRAFT_578046 [Xylaria palmicola]